MSYLFKSDPSWGNENLRSWRNLIYHWRVLGEQNDNPVLLIHGFGASSEHWRHNALFLKEAGYRVYGLDLIGFGKSEQPGPNKVNQLDNKFWGEQVADFIKEVIQKNNSEKTIVIGNSLGSLVALTVSVTHSNLIKALIAAPLPDPALMKSRPLVLKKTNWFKTINKKLVRIFFNIFPFKILITFIAKTRLIDIGLQFAYFRSIKNDLALKQIVKKPAQKVTASRALKAMCIGMATREDFYTAPFLLNRLEKMTARAPFLLIWGRKDKLVPLFIGKRLINRYHWIKLIIIENTGHCPHDESPDEFNQCVINWLRLNS